jgi:hypothetical protein
VAISVHVVRTELESLEISVKGRQTPRSSSFLKKRTKKLLLASVRAGRNQRVSKTSTSFLFLFFKKEILPCSAGVAVQPPVGITG